MLVGFLPVIPEPITNYASVRQLCLNFENIRQQLNQPDFAMWYDQPMYDTACEVILTEPEPFKHLVPCMGSFYGERILLKCHGHLLHGSGVDNSLVECQVFGKGVLGNVLNGSHYYRALAGFQIFEDVIMTMMYAAFWQTKKKENYLCITELEELSKALTESKPSAEKFNELCESVALLRIDFVKIAEECTEKSGVCEFLDIWLKIVNVIKNAVAADREGNWHSGLSKKLLESSRQ